jgi:polysaccharide export outer membrane protein
MAGRAFPILCFLLLLTARTPAYGFVIGEEDMLQISVWGSPELSVQVPVRPDGMVSLPLLGDVRAAGVTPQELKEKLEADLARFVKAPVVSVLITAINSFKVYVLGDGAARIQGQEGAGGDGGARLSGQVTLRRNTTLLQFLAQLGAPGDFDLKKAYLLRAGRTLEINFVSLVLKGDVAQDVALEPNDLICLPSGFGNRIRVVGAVRTPGVIPFAQGMTALDAVLTAGGFTDFASQNNVLIVRQEEAERENIVVHLKDVMNGDLSKNVALKPGDIVTVRTGIF